MFLKEQRYKYCIDTYRFALPCSARHQQVGHSGQVYYIVLVIYFFTEGYRQAHLIVHKLFAGEQRLHGYDLLVGIRYFYAYGAAARYRRYDTYAEGRKVECYIILQVPDLGDAHTFSGYYLVEGYSRAYSRCDGLYLDTKAA